MFKFAVLTIITILSRLTDQQYQYLGGYDPNLYSKEEWKSIVVIEFDYTHVCSGTVVDRIYVLTAAHCVDRNFSNNLPFKFSNLTCRVGGFINELSDSVIPVEYVYMHPDYNLTAGIADIALLKLRFPVRPGVKTIPLPISQLSYGSHCHLAGWRDLEYDQNTTKKIVPIIPLPKRTIYVSDQALMDLSACEEALREINYEIYNEVMSSKANIISPSSICTKSKPSENRKINESFTDSGGPIICDDELHGIQSFLLEMRDERTFFVSTRVDQYIDWVANLTRKPRDDAVLPQILTEEDLAKEQEMKSIETFDNSSNSSFIENYNQLTVISVPYLKASSEIMTHNNTADINSASLGFVFVTILHLSLNKL